MASRLSEVLGNNFRMRNLIMTHNRRAHYPLVDDKLLTSKLAAEHGIAMPEIYLAITSHSEINAAFSKLASYSDFVVKPSRGSQGGGILIVNGVKNSEDPSKITFQTNRLGDINFYQFKHYISGVLSGLYSMQGHVDSALIQKKIVNLPYFQNITDSGIPDIRVIVYKGFPIMAMLRLPTDESGGRGNLHLGAVGVGLNLKNGSYRRAIMRDKEVLKHPNSEFALTSLKIDAWSEVLNLASKCADLVDIGYLGVDIIIDKVAGPQLLEMNARPGLSIQLANLQGLKPIIKKVNQFAPLDLSSGERVLWSLEHL